MAAEASPDLHTKTHFRGGASILMNQDNEAKLSLNLKGANETQSVGLPTAMYTPSPQSVGYDEHEFQTNAETEDRVHD